MEKTLLPCLAPPEAVRTTELVEFLVQVSLLTSLTKIGSTKALQGRVRGKTLSTPEMILFSTQMEVFSTSPTKMASEIPHKSLKNCREHRPTTSLMTNLMNCKRMSRS